MSESVQLDPEGLKNGDHKSFEQVFFVYYNRIFYFIKNYVPDTEVARELTQETFAKLWEIRQSLHSDSTIPALLYTMARNNALNYLDHLLAQKRYIEYNQKKYYEIQLNCYALRHDTIEDIFADELQVKINTVMNSLPAKCRSVFELSRIDQLSYKEIAEKLNISVKTVENHISEALKRFRDCLQDETSH